MAFCVCLNYSCYTGNAACPVPCLHLDFVRSVIALSAVILKLPGCWWAVVAEGLVCYRDKQGDWGWCCMVVDADCLTMEVSCLCYSSEDAIRSMGGHSFGCIVCDVREVNKQEAR